MDKQQAKAFLEGDEELFNEKPATEITELSLEVMDTVYEAVFGGSLAKTLKEHAISPGSIDQDIANSTSLRDYIDDVVLASRTNPRDPDEIESVLHGYYQIPEDVANQIQEVVERELENVENILNKLRTAKERTEDRLDRLSL